MSVGICSSSGIYRQGSQGPQQAGTLVWSLIQVAGPIGFFRTSPYGAFAPRVSVCIPASLFTPVLDQPLSPSLTSGPHVWHYCGPIPQRASPPLSTDPQMKTGSAHWEQGYQTHFTTKKTEVQRELVTCWRLWFTSPEVAGQHSDAKLVSTPHWVCNAGAGSPVQWQRGHSCRGLGGRE